MGLGPGPGVLSLFPVYAGVGRDPIVCAQVSKASCRALTSVFSEVPSLFGFFPEPEEIPGRRFQALGPVGLQSLQLSQEAGPRLMTFVWGAAAEKLPAST